jgi:hypothetical protein
LNVAVGVALVAFAVKLLAKNNGFFHPPPLPIQVFRPICIL